LMIDEARPFSESSRPDGCPERVSESNSALCFVYDRPKTPQDHRPLRKGRGGLANAFIKRNSSGLSSAPFGLVATQNNRPRPNPRREEFHQVLHHASYECGFGPRDRGLGCCPAAVEHANLRLLHVRVAEEQHGREPTYAAHPPCQYGGDWKL